MPDQQWDEEREAYLSLADEMNDGAEWDPDDWDPDGVKAGAAFAKKNKLRWPPRMGDYDRWYEKHGA